MGEKKINHKHYTLKRKVLQAILCVITSVLLIMSFTGCGEQFNRDKGKNKEGLTDMTEQEKDLLCKVYPNEEMIMEGKLFEYEKSTLEMLRKGLEYLSSEYPTCSFDALSIEPANKFSPWTAIQVNEATFGMATVTVTPEEEGYRFSEDFYGKYFREDYDEMLKEILADEGFEAVTFTDFPSVMEDIGEKSTVEELIAMKANLPRNTHIYVSDVEDRDLCAGRLKDALCNAGVYGAYTVYFVQDGIEDSTEVLESRRTKYEYNTFNCFDVR